MNSIEVLFTPADFTALAQRDLTGTCCVVFDVLRATSSMVAALSHGAQAIVPVAEIGEALVVRQKDASVLLAGEREGVRIGPDLTGGIPFDLGNSPREFTPGIVGGKTIVMTTTNGTRALRACLKAKGVLAASFLNLAATAEAVLKLNPRELLLVCSGTREQAAFEDVLGCGALCDLLWPRFEAGQVADSTHMARALFLHSRDNLSAALSRSRNARRLLAIPELKPDVAFCLRRDSCPLVAGLDKDARIRRQS